MKRLTAIFALVALPLAGCGGSDEPTAFESADGSFSVLFPSEPSLETDTTNVAGYDLELSFYIAEQDDMAFMVNQFDYAPVFADAGLADTIEFEGRDARLIEFEGERSGREFVGTAQVMVDGFELYQVMAVGEGDMQPMSEFVASFDFLTEPVGTDE